MSLPEPYYQDDWVTIYHADCREILPHLPKADLVLTDPPYGYGWKTSYSRFRRGSGDKQEIANDNHEITISEWHNPNVETIAFGANCLCFPFMGSYLIWDKRCEDGFAFLSDAEVAWWSEGKGCYIYSENAQRTRSKNGGLHPTQKPVGLMQWCISKAKADGAILDPFMGSGTTLRAAKDLGRKAIGIEIEEKYCEIAAKRMAQEVFNFN
jgi:site-specific DNA-methyltransferase (adenine-specific)